MTPRTLATTTAVALAAGAALAAGGSGAPASPAASHQAGGEVTYTFQGRGFGHGVGMPQYGARGRALAGWDGGRIVRFYYRGTTLSVVKRRTVRVLLAPDVRSVAVTSAGRWRAVGARVDGPRVTALPPRVPHTLRIRADGRVALMRGARRVALFRGAPRVEAVKKGGTVSWGPSAPEADRTYRGALRVVPTGGDFSLVNVVDLEDYLKGVVPREMPADWGDDAPAALVAQAVAARSYAIATMSPTAVYDIFDDTRSQVYGGRTAEDPRTNRAVDSTRGTVLTYQGEVIVAFFYSSSGGRTENIENMFPGAPRRPYLVSVPDPYDRVSPYHRSWPDPPTHTAAEMGRMLGMGAPVTEFTVLKRGVSPRVVSARATTASGRSKTFGGLELRRLLGLRDSWFTVTRRPPAAP
ncbi:MAG: SpoIID/LytB domain-containing protein [Thermoleophilia bacterium]